MPEPENPQFTVIFDSAKVVNLETGEENEFRFLKEAAADPIAGQGLRVIDEALEKAGGTAIQEPEDEAG